MKFIERYLVITWDNTRYYGTSDNPQNWRAPVYQRHGPRFDDWKLATQYAIRRFGVTRNSYGIGLLGNNWCVSVIGEFDATLIGIAPKRKSSNLVTGGKLP